MTDDERNLLLALADHGCDHSGIADLSARIRAARVSDETERSCKTCRFDYRPTGKCMAPGGASQCFQGSGAYLHSWQPAIALSAGPAIKTTWPEEVKKQLDEVLDKVLQDAVDHGIGVMRVAPAEFRINPETEYLNRAAREWLEQAKSWEHHEASALDIINYLLSLLPGDAP